MTRLEIATQVIAGLFASGHFTEDSIDGPWPIVSRTDDDAHFAAVEAAFRIADEMLEEEGPQ